MNGYFEHYEGKMKQWQMDALVKAMVDYKKDFEMHIYPNAAHAFFNETFPMYQEAAARDAWERVLALYKITLLAGV